MLVKRLWDSRTTARFERMMRSAEASGDLEAALEWEARAAAFRRDRHIRRMDLLELPIRIFGALPKVAAGTVALLVGLGILLAIADHDTRKIAVPVLVVARIVQFVGIVVSVAWGPLVLAAPWVLVLALWRLGRASAAAATAGPPASTPTGLTSAPSSPPTPSSSPSSTCASRR